MNSTDKDRMTKNERRAAAREKARLLREEQLRKEKRNKFYIIGGSVVGSVVLVALIAWAVIANIPTPQSGPNNMLSSGVIIGKDLKAETTRALAPEEAPVYPDLQAGPDNSIVVYYDYLCPHCQTFDLTNGSQLAEWAKAGEAKVEFRPVAIMDRVSQGKKSATRAANAAACVIDKDPDNFFGFHELMIQWHSVAGTEGLSNKELKEVASLAGVTANIDSCIDNQDFSVWISEMTKLASGFNEKTGQIIPGSNEAFFTGTPTILINGTKYVSDNLADPDTFRMFYFQVTGTGEEVDETEESAE